MDILRADFAKGSLREQIAIAIFMHQFDLIVVLAIKFDFVAVAGEA